MLITYLIFLLLAVVFKTLHFPGSSILFLVSILFPTIDILVQLLRKKEDKETRIWSAVATTFLSVFLLFKFQYWPGSTLLFYPAIVFSIIYFIRVYQKRKSVNYRFYVLLLIVAFSTFNYTMTGSKFRMFYMTEDPFSTEEQVPTFFRQKLAYSFYKEGDYAKAEQLIELNIAHLERLLLQEDAADFEREVDEGNLAQSKMDLEMIQKRTWDNFIPLFPEDRAE